MPVIIIFGVLITLLIPIPLKATSQCPPETECEVPIEVKVTFLVMAEVLKEPCIQLDNANRDTYGQSYRLLEEKLGEDVKVHKKYNEAKTYYQHQISTMSNKKLNKECAGFKQIIREAESLD